MAEMASVVSLSPSPRYISTVSASPNSFQSNLTCCALSSSSSWSMQTPSTQSHAFDGAKREEFSMQVTRLGFRSRNESLHEITEEAASEPQR